MIRTALFTAALAISTAAFADGETLVLEGNFQNKNLFVTNCFGDQGVGFAVSAVRVNGEITSDAINSSAFEIDLSALGLKQGESVTIEIEYEGPCTPKVLNPGALQPLPTFEVADISIANDGMLSWSTTNETGSLPYTIEQFKWNKWVKVGEVDGVGTPDQHQYNFKAKLISGQNKFRVVQKNLNGNMKHSKSVSLTTTKDQPTSEYNKREDKLVFSEETSYEVYDMYGQIRKRGYAKSIDFSNLESGDYYVNFDNTMSKVRKK